MSPPENNDPLDAFLRENDPYINDEGFAARVMASLPPRRSSWWRPAILCGAVFLGLALLLWLLPASKEAFSSNANGGTFSLLNLQSILTLLALLLSSASLGWGILKALQPDE